ncbi:MAG: (2Fe-2S) ferredoxin domain-containing protein [Capsulimonadaceae bacterium]|nr:(2Fe-2S) ferredoxin domain-containing protein [Capsulimonadaceae bacterium]
MTEPVEIVVCMGSSCFSRGNSANLAAIKKYIGEHGDTFQVRLVGSRCEERCMEGPTISVGGTLIREASPAEIPSILDKELRK